MISRIGGAGLAAGLVLAPGPAAAHGSLGSAGPFISGAIHPFLVLQHVLLLVALGLLAGRVPHKPRTFAFGIVALGVLVGLSLQTAEVSGSIVSLSLIPAAILWLSLVAGVLLALALPQLPTNAIFAIALLAGVAVGLDSDVTVAPGAGAISSLVAALGLVLGVGVIVIDAAAFSNWAVCPPLPIAVRVAGSWIAAISLLLLALAFAPAI